MYLIHTGAQTLVKKTSSFNIFFINPTVYFVLSYCEFEIIQLEQRVSAEKPNIR